MSEITERKPGVCIDVCPSDNTDIFRIRAADEIVRLLVDAHEAEFAIPELVDATGAARSTVWRAVELLQDVGAVRVRETPQRNYVSIDPDRLQKGDPVLAIEQSEFHAPVRSFVGRVGEVMTDAEAVTDLVGVVVFGSVARGEADRRSDIDVFAVVEGDRTTARRLVTDVVSGLENERFDGDRFDFEPYVESVESARRAAGKLRKIFAEGITVYGSDDERFQSVREAVIADE